MSNALDLTDANFDEVTKSGICLIDFWGHGCPPCMVMAPIIDELAAELADKVTVAKVNAHEEQAIGTKFQIMFLPTFCILKDGERVAENLVGQQQKETLVDALKAAIGDSGELSWD